MCYLATPEQADHATVQGDFKVKVDGYMKVDDGADNHNGGNSIFYTPTLQILSYSSMSVRYRSRPCLARKSLESLLSAAYHHAR